MKSRLEEIFRPIRELHRMCEELGYEIPKRLSDEEIERRRKAKEEYDSRPEVIEARRQATPRKR